MFSNCLSNVYLFALYNPLVYLPNQADLLANREVIELLKKVFWTVWIPYHSYLAYKAGKPRHAHILAMVDVKQSDREGASIHLENELQKKVNDQLFAQLSWMNGIDMVWLKHFYQASMNELVYCLMTRIL